MPCHRIRKPIRTRIPTPCLSRKRRVGIKLLGIFLIISSALFPSWYFLRSLSGQIALSDAIDIITLTINDTINEKMQEGKYDYNYFVTLQKDNEGTISAITTNMARVNTLSSELIQEIVAAGSAGDLDIKVPLGNLFGFNLLVGKGPDIPIKIVMLTSSYADFRNEFTAAGINQSKHQIILELVVEIDVLIPWETLSTQVISEVLIAETIIVGKVPETYLTLE